MPLDILSHSHTKSTLNPAELNSKEEFVWFGFKIPQDYKENFKEIKDKYDKMPFGINKILAIFLVLMLRLTFHFYDLYGPKLKQL